MRVQCKDSPYLLQLLWEVGAHHRRSHVLSASSEQHPNCSSHQPSKDIKIWLIHGGGGGCNSVLDTNPRGVGEGGSGGP